MKNSIIYIISTVASFICIQASAQNALTHIAQDATTQSGCKDGIIDLTINGGFPPYDVEWTGPNAYIHSVYGISGSDDQEDIYDLVQGTYQVLVTDALCGTVELTVEIGC